jgi:hypothetical protein
MRKGRSWQSKQGSDYSIGYGKPPITSRFKPGETGNAKGRPKGHKNLKTLIRQAMTARIVIQEGSSKRGVSKIEGVVLRQLQNALKGNDRAAMAVIRMAHQLGFLDDVADGKEAGVELTAADERILKELIARRKGNRR